MQQTQLTEGCASILAGQLVDAGMSRQDHLDLGGKHVLPARDDHVFEPVAQEEVMVLVEVADVPGAEPAVGREGLAGRAGLGWA